MENKEKPEIIETPLRARLEALKSFGRQFRKGSAWRGVVTEWMKEALEIEKKKQESRA